MEDAVIVATARTPIARAVKGSLVDCRADDLAALVVQAALEKVPDLDPTTIEDLVLGCAQPAGESGYNLARVVAVLSGLNEVPGTTVNRYCSSSLQALRIAFHAVRAGEGDVFMVAGVESTSRFDFGKADDGAHNPRFAEAEARSEKNAHSSEPWVEAPGLPDIYIATGQTAENVRINEGVTREEMDQFALLSQQRAVRAQDNGFFEREIVPVPLPGGGLFTQDECPRRGVTF